MEAERNRVFFPPHCTWF